MAGKNFLEKLILSLSDSEVRDFKWFAQKSGIKPKYVDLLNYIRAGLVKGKKRNKPPLTTKQLSFYRTYLKNQILKSLALKYFLSQESEIRIYQAIVLAEKGFISEAKEELEYAKRDAENRDSRTELIKILDLESMLFYPDALDSPEKHLKLNETIREFYELKAIRINLVEGLKDKNTPEPKISLIESLIRKNPILSRGNEITNIRNKAEYHQIKRIIHIYKEEYSIAEFNSEQYVALREQYPERFSDDKIELVRELGHMVNFAVISGDTQKVTAYLTQFESIHPSTPYAQAEYIRQFYVKKLIFALEAGDEKGAKKALSGIRPSIPFLKVYLSPIQHQRILYYSAYFGLMSQDWVGAIRDAKDLISSYKPKSRNLFWQFSRLILILALLENGDHYELENEIERVNRYFKKNPTSYHMMTFLPERLEKFLSTPDSKHQEFWKGFKAQIQNISSDPFQARAFNYVDLPEWIEAKISGRKWIDISHSNAEKVRMKQEISSDSAGAQG